MCDENTSYTPNTIPEKASGDFNGWNDRFKEEIEDTTKDVESLKKLAFTVPEELPLKLHWFWVAKVLADIARFMLVRTIEIKEDFTSYDAKKILNFFLSDVEMDMEFDTVKAKLAMDFMLEEQFRIY